VCIVADGTFSVSSLHAATFFSWLGLTQYRSSDAVLGALGELRGLPQAHASKHHMRQEPHRSLRYHRDRLGDLAVSSWPRAHKGRRKTKDASGRRKRRLWVLVKRERYVIPNLITSLGLLLGCYSVAISVNGQFYRAALMIELAALCDGLDGVVARASNTASPFGVEYDSLSDVVAFGVAPASLAYMWALRPLGNVGLIEAGLFVVCGALRLARFNVQTQIGHPYFFRWPADTGCGDLNRWTALSLLPAGFQRAQDIVPFGETGSAVAGVPDGLARRRSQGSRLGETERSRPDRRSAMVSWVVFYRCRSITRALSLPPYGQAARAGLRAGRLLPPRTA